MENINKELQKFQENNLRPALTNTSNSQNSGSISIYKDELTSDGVKKNALKMISAFPDLTQDEHFLENLSESLVRNRFTDERLKDAVNYLIDNYKYPRPKVADIVSFDKTIKTFSYHEICHIASSNQGLFSDYTGFKFEKDSVKVYVRNEDYLKYDLELINKIEK